MKPVAEWPEACRMTTIPGSESHRGDEYGVFVLTRGTTRLACVVSAGDSRVPWEHVSVTIPGHKRTPTWEEMDTVKRLFWRDAETVMQLHVPRSDHKNFHPWCLHLWRPTKDAIPRPPSWTVA